MPCRLLLDENLSERILPARDRALPGSVHVRVLGESGASGRRVWEIARDCPFVPVIGAHGTIKAVTRGGSGQRIVQALTHGRLQ